MVIADLAAVMKLSLSESGRSTAIRLRMSWLAALLRSLVGGVL